MNNTTLKHEELEAMSAIIKTWMIQGSSVDQDLSDMHMHYGFSEAVSKLSQKDLKKLLEFRHRFLEEEMQEGKDAIRNNDPEEVVDYLIDLIVVAVGTLDLFCVDFQEAWQEVLKANMSKEVGVKPSRPNPLGLPDLIKPEGWIAPKHGENIGILGDALDSQR